MGVSYRFCKVDPGTWLDNEVIEDVETAEITFDLGLDTKGVMTLTCAEGIGEAYIRAYMVEDDVATPVGTFLAQTQSSNHDGRVKRYDIEAYSPLHELNETYPPIGYYVKKGARITTIAFDQIAANCRAPLVSDSTGSASSDTFIAEVDETWLVYLTKLLEMDAKTLIPDYDGTILIVPMRSAESMQPAFEFADDSASIVRSDIEEQLDLYQIPNKVVAIADNGMYATATNTDPDSPLSIANRGRTIEMRVTDPSLPEGFTHTQLASYAKRVLDDASLVEHTVQFTHAWVPRLHIGDCVRIDFDRADIHTKAIVTSMKLTCDKTAQVQTTASYMEVMT